MGKMLLMSALTVLVTMGAGHVQNAASAEPLERRVRQATRDTTTPGGGPESSEDARAFLEKYAGWESFVRHSDEERHRAAEMGIVIARGCDPGVAAQALMVAARAYCGMCQMWPDSQSYRALGDDGWDRAIALYQRVVDEFPKTPQARQAEWLIATCYGAWGRCGCCRHNQGKQDRARATAEYWRLYETSEDPGSKCDALRRIAEMQCLVPAADRGRLNADVGVEEIAEWRGGLRKLGRMFREFPGDVPASPYRTRRACGVMDGKSQVDYFLMRFCLGPLLQHAPTPEAAQGLREEFVALAPELESIRHHSLLLLESRLRELGDVPGADAIRERLGVCEDWLVIGPLGPPRPDSEKVVGRAHDVEGDVLGNADVDLSRVYTASWSDNGCVAARWGRADTVVPVDLWEEIGVYYALTYVEAPVARRGQLRLGTSGWAQAWMNGEEVFRSGGAVDWPVMDQEIHAVALRRGRNQLLIKFVPYDGHDACVRITAGDGVGLEDIAYWAPDAPRVGVAAGAAGGE